jgi:copper(I)-binding protein
MRPVVRPGIAVLVVATVATVGCGGDTEGFAATAAWARPTPATATDGVVYLKLSSDVDDTLVGVDVPATVARTAELHTSDAGGGGGHMHGGGGGEMVTMTPVEDVAVAAGETIEFRPGGNHIMLVDLAEPLAIGDSFTATLRFSSGRTLAAEVTVSDNPPSS